MTFMLYTWKQRKQDFLLLHTEQEISEKKRKNYELNETKRSQFSLNFVGALFIPPPATVYKPFLLDELLCLDCSQFF